MFNGVPKLLVYIYSSNKMYLQFYDFSFSSKYFESKFYHAFLISLFQICDVEGFLIKKYLVIFFLFNLGTFVSFIVF